MRDTQSKEISPIKIASHWLAIYNITPPLIKLAHFLYTCWRKTTQSWQFSPKLFTNCFNGSCAPNSFAGVIRDILVHTIVQCEHLSVDSLSCFQLILEYSRLYKLYRLIVLRACLVHHLAFSYKVNLKHEYCQQKCSSLMNFYSQYPIFD